MINKRFFGVFLFSIDHQKRFCLDEGSILHTLILLNFLCQFQLQVFSEYIHDVTGKNGCRKFGLLSSEMFQNEEFEQVYQNRFTMTFTNEIFWIVYLGTSIYDGS